MPGPRLRPARKLLRGGSGSPALAREDRAAFASFIRSLLRSPTSGPKADRPLALTCAHILRPAESAWVRFHVSL